MIRVICGFKIGLKMHPSGDSPERFLDEESAKKAIVEHAKRNNIVSSYYRVFPCFLLEVQTDRGEPLHFDLGNPVEVAR